MPPGPQNSGVTLNFTASIRPRSVILISGMGGSVRKDIAMKGSDSFEPSVLAISFAGFCF